MLCALGGTTQCWLRPVRTIYFKSGSCWVSLRPTLLSVLPLLLDKG